LRRTPRGTVDAGYARVKGALRYSLHVSRLGLAVLVGIALGFVGGWLVFDSSGKQHTLTRAQAEQAVIRDGDESYDAAECREAGSGEFSCKALSRSFNDDDLHFVSTVRVFERHGKAVTEGAVLSR
jgi:hypothetical protein